MSAFITFEGPDGSGKSTICNLVYEELLKNNKKTIKTREPGGTRISEKIRDLILDKDLREMDMRTEALLYSASRAQHTYEKIIPALEEGAIVLCERYVLSSLAYQGYARGQDLEDILSINNFATGKLSPMWYLSLEVVELPYTGRTSLLTTDLKESLTNFTKKFVTTTTI